MPAWVGESIDEAVRQVQVQQGLPVSTLQRELIAVELVRKPLENLWGRQCSHLICCNQWMAARKVANLESPAEPAGRDQSGECNHSQSGVPRRRPVLHMLTCSRP